jgi:branched-chain amino acid transport system permease protein
LLLLLGLFLFPLISPSYIMSLAVEVLLFAVFAMSLDLLLGYTGLVSFGHAAFFGLGGYILAYVARGLSANLLVTMPLVIIGTALGAAIIGFFALRTTGIYFLMLTLAFAQMLFGLAVKWTPVTGGSDGLPGVPRPYIGLGDLSWRFGSNLQFYYLVVLVFVISWWLLRRLVESPFGHTLRGIKENESRMRALGYNTWRFKMAVFVIAGVFAGLSGAFFAHFNWHAAPENLYWTMSGQVLLMVIVGGSGTLSGPILGAALVRLLPSYASTYTDRWQTILGLVFVAFVLFAPHGIIGLIKEYQARRKGSQDAAS